MNYLGLTDEVMARFWAIKLGDELTAEERVTIRRADDKHPVGTCVDCGEEKLIAAKGQCWACYQWERLQDPEKRARHLAQQRAASGKWRTDHPIQPRKVARGKGARGGSVTHGTRNGYAYWGCRCDQCRAANTTALREYREWQRSV